MLVGNAFVPWRHFIAGINPMPLRDHFHPPWSEEDLWEGFHSAWVNTMVRHLNGSLLPRRFRARPNIHLGPFVEADVATFDRDQETEQFAPLPPTAEPVHGETTAVWTPPAAVQTLDIEFPAQDVFEVRIHDERRGMRLVAVVELVSPGNKDRSETRHAFAAKCAGYLQEQVSVVVVDVVTARHANLHRELLEMFGRIPSETAAPDLYAVSYRNRKTQGKWHLDLWPCALVVGGSLPSVPLWLDRQLAVQLDLENSYEETCRVLRID
jgi:hypothetical protein